MHAQTLAHTHTHTDTTTRKQSIQISHFIRALINLLTSVTNMNSSIPTGMVIIQFVTISILYRQRRFTRSTEIKTDSATERNATSVCDYCLAYQKKFLTDVRTTFCCSPHQHLFKQKLIIMEDAVT